MALPTVPQGWSVRGDVPLVEVSNFDEISLDALDEDMLQVVETSGTFTLDVGWYPSGSPEGKFICRTVLSNNWEDPVEELETRRPHVVMQWLQSWVDEIQARLGEHAEISEQAIATVLVPLAMDSQTPITGDAQRVSRVPRLTSSSAAFQSSDAAR